MRLLSVAGYLFNNIVWESHLCSEKILLPIWRTVCRSSAPGKASWDFPRTEHRESYEQYKLLRLQKNHPSHEWEVTQRVEGFFFEFNFFFESKQYSFWRTSNVLLDAHNNFLSRLLSSWFCGQANFVKLRVSILRNTNLQTLNTTKWKTADWRS